MTKQPNPKSIRCAIYTRKSTEEGLDQEFNTLDAQRESGEAFIQSQQHEGWQCLPDHYDDGGFTGGNMDRPALKRLIANIEAGRIDCVVVYKVDRLSRSLLDFAKLLEVFERFNVAFVSVTQQFNTTTSMGRLMLNVLLSFAQFEREIISERTRDKIAATRRKGKWSGGLPLLGYDVVDTKLVVNQHEADRVRQIFETYLERQSLLATVKELNCRGWTTKHWVTRKEHHRGGRPFTKNNLYQLLTNVTYIGKIKYKTEVHEGEHDAIVDTNLFQRVQAALRKNGTSGGRSVRNKHGALLNRLLRCAGCGCAMSHTYTVKGNRRYRYYVCGKAQQHGWQSCSSPSIPAGEIERFVIDEIKCIGRDPDVLMETVRQVRCHADDETKRMQKERKTLKRQLAADDLELRRLAASPQDFTDQLADIHERIRLAERQMSEIENELAALANETVEEQEVANALAEFERVWGALTPSEQCRMARLLIEQVNYDGKSGTIAITFHPTGIKTLANEFADYQEPAA